MKIARWMRGLATLKSYKASFLPHDLAAGLTLGAVALIGPRAPQPVRGVAVDGGAIHDVDLMACEMLAELDRELGERGIALAFGNLRDRVRRDIERGLSLAPDANAPSYPSVSEAALAVRARAVY